MLSLGLNLLGIGKHLLGWVSGAFKWLFAKWYRVALLVALAAFLWAYTGWTFADRRADKEAARAEKNEKKYKAEAAAHITTKVNVANAQRVAAEMNRKQIETIKERYDAIAEKSEIDYEKRLASNKLAINNWLRSRTIAGLTEGSRTGTASEVQSEASGTEAMPIIPRGFVIVPESDLDKTADIQATLAALQEAARAIEQSGNMTSSGRD